MENSYDIIIIGGGQSGLTCGYHLRRSNFSFLILDKQEKPGGAWNNAWDSLTLFSPAEHSSLAGWQMPKSENLFPSKDEVISYLDQYEEHYQLPIKRNTEVLSITNVNKIFSLKTTQGDFYSKVVIGATGTWNNPFIPNIEGKELYKGIQIHSAHYKNTELFKDLNVLVVGEGNSGAQLVAEISKVANVKWSTKKEPQFLPDDVDGFSLFNTATAKYKAEKEGKPFIAENYDLGNIVMVPSVNEARDRGILISSGIFQKMDENGIIWENGTKESFDIIVWCTGFGFATSFLKGLVEMDERGIVKTVESKVQAIDGLWLVGYGGWTGFASATLIGINRNVKLAIQEVEDYLLNSLKN